MDTAQPRQRFTMKNVLIGNLRFVLFVSLFVTPLINPIYYPAFEYIGEHVIYANSTSYNVPLILAGFYVIRYFVLALPLSLLIAWGISNIVLKAQGPMTDQRFAEGTRFQWHVAYFLLIPCVLVTFLSLEFHYADILTTLIRSHILGILFSLLSGIMTIGIVLYVFHRIDHSLELNAKLVARTGANRVLIEEYEAGFYNHLIPKRLRNQESHEGIRSMMENAYAASVRGAILAYRFYAVYRVLSTCFKVILAIAPGVIAIILLFGLDKVFLSADDAIEAIAEDVAIGMFLPFDPFITICVIVSFIIIRMLDNLNDDLADLARMARNVAIVCFVVALTPLGIILPVMTNSITHAGSELMEGNYRFAARESDYILSDVEVTLPETTLWPIMRGTGTLTNTTEDDWENVVVSVYFVEAKERPKRFLPNRYTMDIALPDLPAGGSVSFVTQDFPLNELHESDVNATFAIEEVRRHIVEKEEERLSEEDEELRMEEERRMEEEGIAAPVPAS